MGVPRIRRLIHSMVNKLFLLVLLISFAFSPYSSIVVFAAPGVPEVISHQGRLLDSSGNLLGGSGGTNYCFRFSFFDDATVGGGDNQLWPVGTPSTMTASVVSGVFNIGIGDTGAGGDTLDFDFNSTDTAYLNTEVAAQVSGSCVGVSFENLSPRQKINSSGYAINASTVGGFTPAQSATGDDIVALTSDDLILGGTNPDFGASGSNTLTIQGNGATGNINFFSTSNSLSSTGNLDVAGTLQSGSSNVALTLATGFVDADALTLTTAADGGSGTSSGSGLIVRSDGIGLLQGCNDGQILKWAETTDTWDCAADAAGGGGGATTALDNLSSVAINTSLVSDTDNTDALGSATIGWSDLFLGGGAVINFNNGDVIATHSADTLTYSGGTIALGTATATGGLTANVTGALTGNADTATALAANPADCGANSFATTIAANGNLTCATIADADVPDSITIDLATLASNVTVVDSTDATSFVGIFDSATGTLAAKTDGALLYNASTGALTATSFVGALTGAATDLNCTDCIGPTEITDLTLGTDTAGNYVATVTGGAGLTGSGASEGSTPTLAVVSGNGAIVANADDITLTVAPSANALSSNTSSGSGLEVVATGLGLLQGCADTQVLKWNETTDVWECANDGNSGDITSIGDVTSGAAFDGTQGTTLTFNDTDGDKTFSYDTTNNEFDVADDLNITGTLVTSGGLAIDATTESNIETALDTLSNVTTVGTLTAGATGAGFTLNFGTSTLSGNIGTANVAGLDISDDTNLTAGDGTVLTGDDVAVDLKTVGENGVGNTTSASGLEFESAQLTLLQGCADGGILKWEEDTDTWDCSTDTDTATAWDTIGDPSGNGAINFGNTEQTMDWEFSLAAFDGMTFNFDNNGTTSGTDNGVVINNAVSTATTTDLVTENLLLIQQLDTTTTGTTVVDNALKIDAAGSSGITDGIHIGNSAGNITNAIDIADTAGGTITTGIKFTGTLTNYIQSVNFTVTGDGDATVAGGLNVAGGYGFDSSGNGITQGLDVNGSITAGSGDEVITLVTGKLDADAIGLTTATNGLTGTSSASGLATYSDTLSLLQGCSDGQVLAWVESTDTWDCTAVGGSGDITSIGDVTSGAAFDGTQGTTLTFNDTDGDKTFSYDTTNNEFDVADDLNITGTLVTSGGLAIDATTETNIEAALDTLSSVTTVGALNAGSITSGFGAIDLGADNFTTTGTANANDFTRSTAGALTFGATNATSIGVGSASVTAFTVTTDGTGTAEIVLPAGSIDSTEILDATVVSGDLATQGTATDEFCLTSETGGGAALAWQDCSATATLQTAYTNGTGALTTTTGKNIVFTLADVASATRFEVTNEDPSASSITYIGNTAATTIASGLAVANTGSGDMASGVNIAQVGAGTLSKGLYVYSNDAGNITDGIHIEEAAGNSITNGIRLSNAAAGTFTTGIKFEDSYTSLIDAPNFDVLNSGNIDTAGTITTGSGNEVITLASGKIDADALGLTTATNGLTGTSSASGLSTYSDTLSLLQGCNDGQILKWVESTDTWDCSADSGGSFDSTTVDSTTWSDGANASNVWTFDVSGTDTTITFGNGLATFSNGVTVTGVLATSGGLTIDATTESNIEAALDTLSSVTTVGALNAGSITSGFGAIDTGADAITTSGTIGTAATTTFTGAGATFTAALAANGGITFDNSTDTIGAFTAGGTIAISTQTLSGSTGNIDYTNFDVVGSNGNTDIGGTITAGSGNEVLTLSTGKIDADAISLITATDALGTTSSASGLSVYSDKLSLLQGCSDGQVLAWVESTDTWDCTTAGGGSGDITSVGDVASGAAFDGTQGTTLTFNDTDGDQTLLYDTTNNKFVFSDNLSIGSAGVDFTTDGDGALTFLGLGDGSDENLTINFDDISNVVSLSSSTGVTRWDFGAINPSVNDLGFIADANGNELIILDTVASAVNEVTVSNAATGNAVTLAASGGDTDVSLNLTSKGAGVVRVNGDNVLDECIVIAVGDEYSNMTTGTNKAVFRMPFAMTVRSVRASVVTAPTGSVATWDINDGGTTILSTKLTIDASEKTSTTAATPAVISDTALADDAEISIDRDGVGSTVAGAGDKITICGAKDI